MKTKQTSSKTHVNWREKSVHYAGGGFVGGLASGLQEGLSSRKKRKKDVEELFPEAPESDEGLYRRGGKVKYAEGGKVGSMTGMIPKALHKAWGMIPSAADIAVTGKLAATPEEYDAAREAKEKAIEAKQKRK
jgi:hypothetical protein